MGGDGDEVANVTITTRHVVHDTADLLPLGQRQILAIHAQRLQIAVNIGLDESGGGIV